MKILPEKLFTLEVADGLIVMVLIVGSILSASWTVAYIEHKVEETQARAMTQCAAYCHAQKGKKISRKKRAYT